MQKYSISGSVSSPLRSVNSRSFTYSVAPVQQINTPQEGVQPVKTPTNVITNVVTNGSELSSNEGKTGNDLLLYKIM